MFRKRGRVIQYKTDEEVALMRAAGLVVARTLELLRSAVAPGVSTRELDALAEHSIRAAGAVASFKGYHGYPATICASVNAEVVHGIPGDRILREGDVVSLDCGAVLAGWHGDAAITVPVGAVAPEVSELSRVCEQAMWHGIAAARLGGRLNDIGAAIEDYVRTQGPYGIVQDYTGHGIGTEMHQEPHVPNYRTRAKGPRLVKGLVLAVEPMLTLGSGRTRVLADDWTVVTEDGSWAAHTEHTFTLTDDGPWVLTALDGGAGHLAGMAAGRTASTAP